MLTPAEQWRLIECAHWIDPPDKIKPNRWFVRRGQHRGTLKRARRFLRLGAGAPVVTAWWLAASKHMKAHYVAYNLPPNGLLKDGERFGFGCTWGEALQYLDKIRKVLEVERALTRTPVGDTGPCY